MHPSPVKDEAWEDKLFDAQSVYVKGERSYRQVLQTVRNQESSSFVAGNLRCPTVRVEIRILFRSISWLDLVIFSMSAAE